MSKVLIVVDMLNDFINPGGALYVPGGEIIVPKAAQIVAEHRDLGNAIIFLADNHDEDDKEFERFPKHCVKGTIGAEVIQEMGKTQNDYFVAKTRFSGFFGTFLDKILEDNEVDSAEVIGVCTSICVMDTVGGLANRDIKTRVYKDAVADLPAAAFSGIDMHTAALKRMEVIYGTEIV